MLQSSGAHATSTRGVKEPPPGGKDNPRAGFSVRRHGHGSGDGGRGAGRGEAINANDRPSVPSRRPSVAIAPFRNLSHEPDDYFSYGLTEDVIRLLARYRRHVLSRHSVLGFLGRNADPREMGAALGVRYPVQGTVAKHAQQVRITVDLVSAETGCHLWSESYDSLLTHILDVQQSMAQQIAAVIEPELARLEREAAVRRSPVNLGAWDCYQRGLYHSWGFTTPGLAEAEAMFRRGIELDSDFARALGACSAPLGTGRRGTRSDDAPACRPPPRRPPARVPRPSQSARQEPPANW